MASKYARLAKKFNKHVVKKELWNYFIFRPLPFILRKYKYNWFLYIFILLFQRLNERFELFLFKGFLKPGMNVVDIGANMGLFTFAASKGVSSHGKVYSFEPEAGTYKVLNKQVKKLGLENVTIYPLALSNSKGKQKLYLDEVNIGGHSFSQDNVYKGDNYLEVKTVTLDEHFGELGMLDKIDVIKMDTEGSEGSVCMGGKELLKASRPDILMEFYPSAIEACGISSRELLLFLVDIGYDIEVVDKLNKKTTKLSINDVFRLFKDNKNLEYVNLLLRNTKK